MRTTVLMAGLLCLVGAADGNTEKDQKKQLESQAKTLIAQAQAVEKSGDLIQARKLYGQSQSLIDLKPAARASRESTTKYSSWPRKI
jgi:outer membrane protein assembly factor BamD (BamD/ComL family)